MTGLLINNNIIVRQTIRKINFALVKLIAEVLFSLVNSKVKLVSLEELCITFERYSNSKSIPMEI